jgi:hypothetical protein
LAAGRVWRFVENPTLRAWPSTPRDRWALKRKKDGTGHAEQEDEADAERQEREMRNTKRKPVLEGKQTKTNGGRAKGEEEERAKKGKDGQERPVRERPVVTVLIHKKSGLQAKKPDRRSAFDGSSVGFGEVGQIEDGRSSDGKGMIKEKNLLDERTGQTLCGRSPRRRRAVPPPTTLPCSGSCSSF